MDRAISGAAVTQDGHLIIGDDNTLFYTGNQDSFIRLLPSGELDTTFNAGQTGLQNIKPGKVWTTKVLPNGKIMIGGEFDRINQVPRSKLARLNPDGTLDTSFEINTDGAGNYFSQINMIYKITVQSDGKMLVSGNFTYYLDGFPKKGLVRLNPDGSIDETFDPIPIYNGFINSAGSPNKTVVTEDGRILVGNTSNVLTGPVPIPLGLLADGSRDYSFNSPSYGQFNTFMALDIAIQPDGKILFSGGWTINTSDGGIARGYIVRLNADGSIDPTFQNPEFPKSIYTFHLLENGKILIVSYHFSTGSTVSRLNSDGSVDNSFVSGNGADGRINVILPLPDGRILVSGNFTTYNGQARRSLAILDANGNLDPASIAVNREVLDVALDDQGRILLGGEFTSINAGSQTINRLAIARLNSLPSNVRPGILDFDGDGKTDISVFRPNSGEWFILRSSDGRDRTAHFGTATDRVVPADYTGDGRADTAFWRPSTGEWFILRSEDASFYSFSFGTEGDIPAPADFDGDGKADAALFRPSNGTWYINNSGGGVTIQKFGLEGDIPVAADYDGDGRDDIAIYRPQFSEWWINRSSQGVISYRFGENGDLPVQGDYTGDGKADAAVWHPGNGTWQILRSENGSFFAAPFGLPTDIPTPGDFDGDGKNDLAVFRPENGTWYLNQTTGDLQVHRFGSTADLPLPAHYLP
ncbi:MAG: FG-GAP-like repeat-containing protein [Pyrinomonadaceae bacterium]